MVTINFKERKEELAKYFSMLHEILLHICDALSRSILWATTLVLLNLNYYGGIAYFHKDSLDLSEKYYLNNTKGLFYNFL